MAKKVTDTALLKQMTEMTNQLDMITTRLDVAINLLLDVILANEKLDEPHGVTEKLDWLDSSRRFVLRPAEAARILGRRAGDISSRRAEIAKAKTHGRSLRKKNKKRSGNSTGTVQESSTVGPESRDAAMGVNNE